MRGAKARAVYDPASDVVALSISPYPGSVFTWPHPELAIAERGRVDKFIDALISREAS